MQSEGYFSSRCLPADMKSNLYFVSLSVSYGIKKYITAKRSVSYSTKAYITTKWHALPPMTKR